MSIVGKRLPSDPREVLRTIIATYPKADRDKVLRIFTATVIESRELERAVIAEMAESWLPQVLRELYPGLSPRFGTLHQTELPAVVLALELVDATTVSTRDFTQSIFGSLWLCGKSCGTTNPRMTRQALQNRAGFCATHSKVRRQQSQMRWTRMAISL